MKDEIPKGEDPHLLLGEMRVSEQEDGGSERRDARKMEGDVWSEMFSGCPQRRWE